MKVYVLLEGPAEAELLKRLLPPEEHQDTVFAVAGDLYQVTSLARSLLIRRRTPVAAVINSYSVNQGLIDERRMGTEELIRAAAAGIPTEVIVAIPALEIVFFHDPKVVEKILGTKIPREWLPLARRDPVGVLQQLAEQVQKGWNTMEAVAALDSQDIEALRTAPLVEQLSDFIRRMHAIKSTDVVTT